MSAVGLEPKKGELKKMIKDIDKNNDGHIGTRAHLHSSLPSDRTVIRRDCASLTNCVCACMCGYSDFSEFVAMMEERMVRHDLLPYERARSRVCAQVYWLQIVRVLNLLHLLVMVISWCGLV